jgi:hypothetical protein
MPPGHPAYNSYVSYRTIVEIYRDGALIFRGRALYPTDDYLNQRTVLCEGELCFFQDAVIRPYLYQDTPRNVFNDIIATYNEQVDEFKRFILGNVSVKDENDYIRLESQGAESVLDTLNKLLERCGGYFVFYTHAGTGGRVVNWYAAPGTRSSQVIEFGENLLDFSRSGANTALATAVLPYGAQDAETGQRLTIESVNDGKDYIVDTEAAKIRGFIIKPVNWDDVTEPANLLRKAQEWLNENRYIITSLQLTALDLSYLDKDIDTFQVGDTIRVLSKPHAVDEDFLLTDYTMDLLNPANSTITLGKDVSTLTNADVAGDSKNQNDLDRVNQQIKADYKKNVADAVQRMESTMTTLIQQTAELIRAEVSETYATNDEVTAAVTSRMTQFSDEFLFEFESLESIVNENDADAQRHFTELYSYISFQDGDITLGSSDSKMTLTLENDKIVFKKNGVQFGWWDGVDFHTGNIIVEVNERAQFGAFAFVPRSNGSLSFLKVGD